VSTVQVLGVEKLETLTSAAICGVNSRTASSASSRLRNFSGRVLTRSTQATSWPSALISDRPSSGALKG